MADPNATNPVLIVGIPRSGTTWSMQVLDSGPKVFALLEPDNEGASAPAIWGKHKLGRFPALQPGAVDTSYAALWKWILNGASKDARQRLAAYALRPVQPPGRTRFLQGHPPALMRLAGLLGRSPRPTPAEPLRDHRLLIKTVHSPLSVEWLTSMFDLDVVVLLRHPGNVFASWIALDLNEQFVRLEDRPEVREVMRMWDLPRPSVDREERMIWQIGLLTLALEDATRRHPEWMVRTHEQLCVDPVREFKNLYEGLSLQWDDSVEEFLRGRNQPGEGFVTRRVATDLPDAWKQKLNADQVEKMQRVLSKFPLSTWSAGEFEIASRDSD